MLIMSETNNSNWLIKCSALVIRQLRVMNYWTSQTQSNAIARLHKSNCNLSSLCSLTSNEQLLTIILKTNESALDRSAFIQSLDFLIGMSQSTHWVAVVRVLNPWGNKLSLRVTLLHSNKIALSCYVVGVEFKFFKKEGLE